MTYIRFSDIARLLGVAGLVVLFLGANEEAMAQRIGPDGSSASRNYDRTPEGLNRRKRGGNTGRLFLNLAPAIIDGLRDRDESEEREKPRRKRARARGDDEPIRKKPRRTQQRVPSSPGIVITAIPPLPDIPPDRGSTPPNSVNLGTPPSPSQRASATAEREPFREGEVVVLVRGAEPDTVANGIAQSFNLILQDTLSPALLETARIYLFRIPDERAVETVVASLSSRPDIGFAVPNNYYWLQGEARALTADLQYALPKMRIPAAHAVVSGQGISVAVIDSGVDETHPVFKSVKLVSIDVVKRGISGPDMHGTAITGIIAASGDTVGIAPGATIITVRAFAPEKLGAPPATTSMTLARAVDEAFNRGARIFNMSFAGGRDPLLHEMIEAAYQRGAVFVAAAGNEGPGAPPAYPAAYPQVIAITATDEADRVYGQANRGSYVLAAAPGVDILAPVTGQGFDYLSGTSFAAAHVTGVIALLMERNPQLSARAVSEVLAGTALDLGPAGQDKDFGAGLTDAYAALMQIGAP